MNDINIALRLKFKNDLSREAPRAERDLRQLGNAAKSIGKGSGGKLGKDLAEIRQEAGRSERAVRNLDRETRRLNSVNTNAAEREVKQLGQAAKQAQRDLQALNRSSRAMRGDEGQRLDRIEKPASALNSTMGLLKSSAGGAFAALGAFASVDYIVRGMERLSEQAKKLDRDVASVAVTAEMRTPEAIQKIGDSNAKLSVRYGIEQPAVNEARKTFAAAGFGIDQQEVILDPTLKAAKAGDSTGETMAAAVIAAQQALGVKNGDVPAALDMMAKGAKLGSFEVDAMAKNFPALATMYGGTGRNGLQGWAELIAAAQVVRMGAGTQDAAATNLENIISKLSSPDTVKNFKEKGIDLEKLKAKSIKNGTPYMMDVVDEVMRLSNGNEFIIGELFGDMQAKQALAPLIGKRQIYTDFLKQILGDSRGTVDADYDFLRNTALEKSDRRGAALQEKGDEVGRSYNDWSEPLKEWFARTVNQRYGAQEREYEEHQRLKSVDVDGLRERIAEREKQLSSIPPSRFDVDMFETQRQLIQVEIDRLKSELKAATTIQGGDVSGSAESSMKNYNSTLNAEGDKAVEIAREKAAAIRDSLTFTATPTIAPTFLPPTPAGPSAAPLPKDKQSGLQTPSTVKVAQYFPGGNARLAAMRAQREQNRAIRMATARSLSDTGGKLA